jgi:hypothetical protein
VSSTYWRLTQVSYGLGIVVATAALVWVYHLTGKKLSSFIKFIIFPVSFIVFLISSFTDYVASPSLGLSTYGYIGYMGIFFIEYFLYLAYLILFCLYALFKEMLRETDKIKKQQLLSILIGSTLFGVIALSVDFIVPIFFDTFEVADFVTISFFPLLLLIVYSIMKHHLFGIKILMTQFLVVLFLSLLLLNFLLSTSSDQYIWNGIIFIISAFLSYLIVKSMFKEIEFDKKLLEESQKNLDLEKRISSTLAKISEERIKKIEDKVFDKNHNE